MAADLGTIASPVDCVGGQGTVIVPVPPNWDDCKEHREKYPGAYKPPSAFAGGPIAKAPTKVGNAWVNLPADKGSYLLNADGSNPFAVKTAPKPPPRRR
jgi:hypothetical protein